MLKTDYLAAILETDYNINPDQIRQHGRTSFQLVYWLNGNERNIPGNPVDSIRETFKEQCSDLFRVTRCYSKRAGQVNVNIVLLDPDLLDF